MTAKRMNFLIDDESFQTLEAMKKKRGIPYSGTMRRALKFWAFVNQQKADGHEIEVRDSKGKVLHTVTLF
jgi:hypothetical protein